MSPNDSGGERFLVAVNDDEPYSIRAEGRPQSVDRSRCDFARRSGTVALAADLNLDGADVRCEVELSLAELAGTSCLVPLA
jgi:hypothetical protein